MQLEDVTQLLSALVAINSVNPSLVPGAAGEAEIARFVGEWLEQRGLEVSLEEAGGPGRLNVVGVARGTGGGRSLLLNSHLDTVGTEGMEGPFLPAVRDGRLFGRGAQDTKGSLAAFMLAAAEIKRLGLPGNVILAGVADEEYASLGSEALTRSWQAEAALVGEPTDGALAIAHKGFVWLEVETCGVSAHGSRPSEGVDAIVMMGKVLAGLEELARELASAAPHPLLGNGSLHASLIEGGQEMSSYPAHCRLQVERRTLPGETAAGCEQELRRLLERVAAADPAFRGSARATFERFPLDVSADSPLAAVMLGQIERVHGEAAQPVGVSFWTDAAILSAAGIPTVVFGPVGAGLHGVMEWVDLNSVLQCAQIVVAAAQEFCA
jgi:acetylornithine deacetylase